MFPREDQGPNHEVDVVHPYLLFVLFSSAQLAPAQDFFVFPSRGQSQQQMERDKAECQIWARQQTGLDPRWHPGPLRLHPPGKRPKADWSAAVPAVQQLERLEGLSRGMPEQARPSEPAQGHCWAL